MTLLISTLLAVLLMVEIHYRAKIRKYFGDVVLLVHTAAGVVSEYLLDRWE